MGHGPEDGGSGHRELLLSRGAGGTCWNPAPKSLPEFQYQGGCGRLLPTSPPVYLDQREVTVALLKKQPSLHTDTSLWKVANVAARRVVVDQGLDRSLRLWTEELHVHIEPARLFLEVKSDYRFRQ